MATHFSILAGIIPWTEKPARLQSMASQRVGHEMQEPQMAQFDPWVLKISWRRKWQPTSVFLPGESHGSNSACLSSCSWGDIPLVELCVEPAGLCGRCTGVAVPLRVVPSPTGLPSKRCPCVPTREDSGVLCFHSKRGVTHQVRLECLGFPSRRGLTPRGSLECNPEIPAFPGEEN